MATAPGAFGYQAADGRRLAGFRWTADAGTSDSGIVVLVHGMGEHLRRYDHVADALTAHGYVVYGHDHRGHGASLTDGDEPGQLGDNGWFALVEDLNLVIAQAKLNHPGLPVAVVAHSMGSFATQQFLLDHGSDVDAVALTGTAALDLLEPALDLSSDLDLSAFNAPFHPARTDFDWLSRDESVVDAYIADPLCGFGIDAASLKEMFAGARRLAEPAEVARMPHDLPMYLAVGSKDPVNGELSLFWPLVDRYREAGLNDVTVRIHDDGRHEILNEINRADVIEDLLKWLQRVSARPAARTRP
ncbi:MULTISPECIES: alpha/beta fold hydrolase [Mycobacterium]|uniref:Hydrolase n=1 Tax=Mycobacterium kiyosense TaxID=2871094 RepID=A0AA37VA02_9MYCO|nr:MULTISPECIES: alpha/beta fold hydrolase [Mycobacterium]GLB82925.1 hydrolase [Mycobacterium kiyosense]GLB96215.1 hydrolase [Mycobacterium kiyosense]GLD40563.1 hydrolase [Mycobacterium kiyosense]